MEVAREQRHRLAKKQGALMNAKTIEGWIKNLGKRYEVLITEGLIPTQPLRELYEGRDCSPPRTSIGPFLEFLGRNQAIGNAIHPSD